jgi:hypothetical protein
MRNDQHNNVSVTTTTTWTKQQEEEWNAFQSFQSDYSLPDGTIEHSDKPDLMIHGDRTLGIELTSLYIVDGRDAKSEQRQTKPRERVVARAQELHVEAGGRPIELAIGFNPEFPITDVDGLAHSIAEVAQYVQRGAPGQVEQPTYDHLDCINFVHFSGEWANPRWFVQQSYSAPMLRVNRVREIIADKIDKAKGYRSCDAYWLIITMDFWSPAQDQDIEWPTGESVDHGPFEHIFLHKPAYRRVIEVPRAN